MATKEEEVQKDHNIIKLDSVIDTLEERGFEIEQNKDYGAGPIDLVCKINIHPSLPSINCRFIISRSEEVEDLKIGRIISFLYEK